jgi:peptide-methionine (R)-S-oxide reductase
VAKPPDEMFAVCKTDDEWRRALDPERYRVLREHGTEPAGASPLNREGRQGAYKCAGCGAELFDSAAKYDSGSGWPSFTRPREDAVGSSVDNSHFMVRAEVHCRACGGHLGHVFPDGPGPDGLRYCLNGAALAFEPRD